MQERLDSAVADARRELRIAWPTLVDTTTWSWDGIGVRVSGGVLLPAQARRYEAVLSAALAPLAIPSPAVLSSLGTGWTGHAWVEVACTEPLDVHRSPDGDDLQTQREPPARLRTFASHGDRTLVQLPDGTLGWADSVRLLPCRPVDDPWAGIVRARPDVAVPATDPAALDRAAALARERLGRPYLWGGNTALAADCSGFVQSIVYAASGVLLPKHTGEQRRMGLRVGAPSIGPGDLVFVRGRDLDLAHVGLALQAGCDVAVIHSCLSRDRVLEEPLAAFLDRYIFGCARRAVAW